VNSRNWLVNFHSVMMVIIEKKRIIQTILTGERTKDIFREHISGVYVGHNIIVSDGRFKFLISDKGCLVNPVKINAKLAVELPIYIECNQTFLPSGFISDGIYDPNNIYHFILNDFLPYMRLRNTLPEEPPIIFFKTPLPYIAELLKFFNIEWRLAFSAVKIGKIYISTCGKSDRNQAHYPFLTREDIAVAAICSKELDSLLQIPKDHSLGKSTFYIDRLRKRRSLRNDEILRRSRILESVRLEALSFNEQVLLFKKAKVIIAIHGAALINLLWARDVRVIEIVPLSCDGLEFGFGCYEKISKLLGIDYIKVLGRKLENGEFEVEPTRLSSLVNELDCYIDGGCFDNRQ
jgi:hypothetical protein